MLCFTSRASRPVSQLLSAPPHKVLVQALPTHLSTTPSSSPLTALLKTVHTNLLAPETSFSIRFSNQPPLPHCPFEHGPATLLSQYCLFKPLVSSSFLLRAPILQLVCASACFRIIFGQIGPRTGSSASERPNSTDLRYDVGKTLRLFQQIPRGDLETCANLLDKIYVSCHQNINSTATTEKLLDKKQQSTPFNDTQ